MNRSVWVARRPPGYAFLEFDDERDALDAIRALDGQSSNSDYYYSYVCCDQLLCFELHLVALI